MDLQNRLVYLPIGQLEHHPKNPRAGYSGIEELAESIKAKGVMQNLTVVKAGKNKYFVVIGNRRLEAAKAAGLSELPCAIAEMTEQEIVSTMLVENIQRSDLTVFEEAQGFQLMLDLGETVSTIAEKTGFSESTVRRRVKLTELDKDKLRKVSQRQISLSELDKLNEIKDIEKRNKLLDLVGTSSFNYELRRVKDDEARAENEAMWRELGKKHGLVEIERSNGWEYMYIATAHSETEFEDIVKKKALFFSVGSGLCFLYKKKSKKSPKKSKEEIEREKCVEELKDECKRMLNARTEFIKNISAADVKGCESVIAATIVKAATSPTFTGRCYNISAKLKDAMGMENQEDADIVKAATKEPLTVLFKFAYLAIDDSEYLRLYNDKGEYLMNKKLNEIYDFLEACGYQVSDTEAAILNGSSEMFYHVDPIADEVKDEIRKIFPEDAFDETFVNKMYELLKSGADKDAMCKLVSEYAKGKVCEFCVQDDKCKKDKPSAKCWKADEYYIRNAVDEVAARYRVIKDGNEGKA